MKIVNASYEILSKDFNAFVDADDILKRVEKIARVCYKSEDHISQDSADSAKALINILVMNDHEAMLEHGHLTVKFIVDRGVSHELVRHRIASFAQESTRYCNYSKDKFDHEITVIKPCYFEENTKEYSAWFHSVKAAEDVYFDLLAWGRPPQEARAVLPTSLKTELVMTANYREWRHIFRVRTHNTAHPQMREVMIPLYREVYSKLGCLFDGVISSII